MGELAVGVLPPAALASCLNFGLQRLIHTAIEAHHAVLSNDGLGFTNPPGRPAGALEAEGIPFTPAVSGMFVWVDLR